MDSNNNISKDRMLEDIKTIIGYWFCALEDEGVDPQEDPNCMEFAEKYGFTKDDYDNFLRNIY